MSKGRHRQCRCPYTVQHEEDEILCFLECVSHAGSTQRRKKIRYRSRSSETHAVGVQAYTARLQNTDLPKDDTAQKWSTGRSVSAVKGVAVRRFLLTRSRWCRGWKGSPRLVSAIVLLLTLASGNNRRGSYVAGCRWLLPNLTCKLA